LAKVDSAEKALEEKMKPQTVEQIEELEKKMREALDALKERKAELQQPKKEGKKPSQG